MSTKFEQLLDLLVNEEMDKANELFHEIVVDKSREIYENLIAEEDDDIEESDDDIEESDDDIDESAEDDEEANENVDLEDSYMMDGDDEEGDLGGDATDDFGGDIGATDDMDDSEMGGEGGEEGAILDIKNAIAELEAAFAELEQAKGMDGDDEFGADDEFGDEEGDEDEMMGQPAFESRRLREYSETVSAGHGADKKGAAEGGIAGANTGEKMPSGTNTKSPISSGKGKPTTGASAGNILGDQKVGKGTNTGERPDSLNKGIAQVSGEKFAKGIHNVDGAKSGVKTLSKVAGGHGAEKKGAAPGPVGSGSGDKAGQTNIDPATKRQFLPQNR